MRQLSPPVSRTHAFAPARLSALNKSVDRSSQHEETQGSSFSTRDVTSSRKPPVQFFGTSMAGGLRQSSFPRVPPRGRSPCWWLRPKVSGSWPNHCRQRAPHSQVARVHAPTHNTQHTKKQNEWLVGGTASAKANNHAIRKQASPSFRRAPQVPAMPGANIKHGETQKQSASFPEPSCCMKRARRGYAPQLNVEPKTESAKGDSKVGGCGARL